MDKKLDYIFVTGSTGNVGKYVCQNLENSKLSFLRDTRKTENLNKNDQKQSKQVFLDFTKSKTFKNLDIYKNKINSVLLIRPPQISKVKKIIFPFLEYLKKLGVKKIVFLSLIGIDDKSYIPHYKIEQEIKRLEFDYVMIRPSFFMQNLITAQLNEIRENNEIFVPAGEGKVNFIDTRDIAYCVFLALTEKSISKKALEITGSVSYSYFDIAEILSDKLKRKITYKNPSALYFLIKKIFETKSMMFSVVMTFLYLNIKKGQADTTTQVYENTTNKKPTSLEKFIDDHIEYWQNEKDKRQKNLFLTNKGKDLLPEINTALSQLNREMGQVLNKKEINQFQNTLKKMAEYSLKNF